MIEVEVAGIRMRNPFMVASGVLGFSPSLMRRAVEMGAGAVVTKTFTYEAREGYPPPIIYSERCYTLNAVGLSNPGIDGMKDVLSGLSGLGAPLIVSIAGRNAGEFVELAEEAQALGADAVELNLSCPHVEGLGAELGVDPALVEGIVSAVKSSVDIPVFAKLTPNITDISVQGEAAQRGGADAAVAINTVRGMAVDPELMAPVLSNVYGGVSGRAIKPIALYSVYILSKKLDIPVIGVGGVEGWRDAVEFILVGASAVQVGTAIARRGLGVFRSLARGLRRYLKRKGFRSLDEIRGVI